MTGVCKDKDDNGESKECQPHENLCFYTKTGNFASFTIGVVHIQRQIILDPLPHQMIFSVPLSMKSDLTDPPSPLPSDVIPGRPHSLFFIFLKR